MSRETLVRICPVCGHAMWQKHQEVCPGAPQRIAPVVHAEPECECPPGMRHERGCDLAYWPEDAA